MPPVELSSRVEGKTGALRALRRLLLGSTALAPGLLAVLAGVALGATAARAQDATWAGPGADWNTNAHWTPGTVPTGTGTFNGANPTTLTFSAATSVGAILFEPGSPAYSFNLSENSLELAGAGIINNSDNAPTFNPFGLLQFSNTASAGNAIINNTPGATTFTGSSSAATATITQSGGGLLSFTDLSTAGNATIITDAGGLAQFLGNSTGGQAQFVTSAGGAVDFSGTAGPLGDNKITAGSIHGAGNYRLGANQFTVGGNDFSMTVSGSIADGGIFGGTGASLVKEGSGTLTLTSANSYSGGTTINAGTLELAAPGNLGATSAPLSVAGGTLDLGGTSQTTGAMSLLGGLVLNGTLNSTSYNLQSGFVGATLSGGGAVTKSGPGTVTLAGDNTYSGGTTLVDRI